MYDAGMEFETDMWRFGMDFRKLRLLRNHQRQGCKESRRILQPEYQVRNVLRSISVGVYEVSVHSDSERV